jgi:hypothetical protein
MNRTLALLFLVVCSCLSTRADNTLRPIASVPIASTGPIARRFLATPGFSWHSFQSRHIRLHLSSDMAISRAGELADSAESARRAALALIGESDLPDEPPLELVLVETREDMRRLAGRPVAGSGFPHELTVVMVASAGYRSFFRHELTHSYVSRRWGERRAGSWMDEGLAARATGECLGHSFDAVAAGYVANGNAPTLHELTGDFYSIPELPAYFTAASLIDFLQRSEGVTMLRTLWRGALPGVDASHPLGPETRRLELEWRRKLSTIQPAALDSARLRRDGC